ncbi:MAG: hypothetical protein CSA72_01790 [Rhodobacterales bacterium]|nr:MAG: hypothetical protein CSA72_01790 [Rhodobacterales bacterium]
MIRLLALLLVLATGAAAEEKVVLGLSQDEVAITATFDGSDLLIFGAVKRETPPPEGGPLEVVITVSGPLRPITVRRKEQRTVIWVNTDTVEVELAPTFYAVASSTVLTEAISDLEDQRHRVSIPRAIWSVGDTVEDADAFIDALIRIQSEDGIYQRLDGAVAVDEQTLFRTRIALPANLTEGDYATRIFLTREGRVIDLYETSIPVTKVGLEKFLYRLAYDRPLIYGLLSLAIAIAAGWAASAVFRLFKS